MRSFLHFLIALLLLVVFAGTAFFLYSISTHLEIERTPSAAEQNTKPASSIN